MFRPHDGDAHMTVNEAFKKYYETMYGPLADDADDETIDHYKAARAAFRAGWYEHMGNK